jgi:hypothetical protein
MDGLTVGREVPSYLVSQAPLSSKITVNTAAFRCIAKY